MVNSIEILKTISYSKFHMWDVKRYNYVFNNSFENAVSLRDILIPFKQSISKDDLIKNNWSIIKKINFQGELFLRNISEINSYKGNVNKVPDNSIIYSKINVRHGCVYYHEKGQTPFAVSSEYPTFTFDEKRVDGYYLKRVLRSNEFKKLLNTKTSGISKARVKVDEFLDIQIPLPSLEEQNRIVTNYNKKIHLAKKQEQNAKQLGEEIENYLFEVLGIINNIGEGIKKGIQSVNYSSINKWSLDDIFKKNTIKSKKYKLTNLSSVCSVITDGTHQTPTYFDKGVVFISARNVTKEVIDWNRIKYVSEEAYKGYSKNIKPQLNDIFLAKNGTTGVAAILDKEKKFSYYVSLALLRPIQELINPYFLLRVINSDIARLQFFSRLIGIGVPNLHLGEIRDVKIPLPPLETQTQIANHILNLKQQIKDLQTQAKENKEKAIEEFEKEIFT